MATNLLNFCTPSKLVHSEDDTDEEEYPNTIIKSRSKFDLTPATVNESPEGSVISNQNLMSLSSEDDSSAFGFDHKPTQISFDEKSMDSSSSSTRTLPSRRKFPSLDANYVVLAFVLLLLRLIWIESSSSVNVNIQLSPQMTKFESFEDYQQAPRQFAMPIAEDFDQLPDIKTFKFYKLEQDASGSFLATVQGKDILGPPRPFSQRWMKHKSIQFKKTSAYLKEKSEMGVSEVLRDDHILI